MKRFIEIFSDDDIQRLTTTDLPLVISLDLENIQIDKITQSQETEQVKHGIHCAYLAEEDGHLFLQPEINTSTDKEIKIFHNDELISKSVWIKSEDIIRIENKVIVFKISGDRIEIKILDSKDTTILSPPPIEELIVIKTQGAPEAQINDFPEKTRENKRSDEQRWSVKSHLFILILIILTAVSGFMIIAESVTINIEPETDEMDLTGKFPVINLADRYILISGNYHLKAKKAGYKPLNKSITIDANNNLFSFQMQETPGLVVFNIDPREKNDIYINEQLLAKAFNEKEQPIKYEIDKGEYELKIINPKYKTFLQKIKIEGKSTIQTFSIALIPNWGVVEIQSNPERANIDINRISEQNNKVLLATEHHKTPARIELAAGTYELTVRKEKFKNKTLNFTVDAGNVTRLDMVELEAKEAKIVLSSEPQGALIRVNGQYQGKTPLTLVVKPFVDHQIETSLSGFKDKKQTVTLQADSHSNIHVKLEPTSGVVFISSSPTQAKLYINGKVQKSASGKFVLRGKNNTLTVKAEGYKSQTKKINANSYTKNISFILKKNVKKNSSVSKVKPGNYTSAESSKKVNGKNTNIRKSYKNSIGLKMVLLPPGKFTMGSAKNEIGRRSNEPEHLVQLNQAFYLSDKEITNQQYKQFDANHKSGFSSGQSLELSRLPVVNVSWNDAARFANWLSKKEGLQPYYKVVNGKMVPISLSTKVDGYRLPFESEWEYAARGQNNKKYPWIGSYPPKFADGNFADESARRHMSLIIEGYNDSYAVAAPVGSYKKNEFGLYDMGGNVSEWCQDYYIPYSMGRGIAIDPVGPERGQHKVVRDSSWKDASITELRLSYRGYSKKAKNEIGFRMARSAL